MNEEILTREILLAHVFDSKIFKDWHFFQFHFKHLLGGVNEAFAESIINACLNCDERIPGFGKGFINELASICGRENHQPHYEQLLQRLCELHVINRTVDFDWPFPSEFKWEPRVKKGGKTPEITIEGGSSVVGIEVKCPSLISHINLRGENSTQVPARGLFEKEDIESIFSESGGITFPRDNPIKDIFNKC